MLPLACLLSVGATLPHILLVVVDDFGWAEVGYHRKESGSVTPEVATPAIDRLVREGVELNRHYVHMMCTNVGRVQNTRN